MNREAAEAYRQAVAGLVRTMTPPTNDSEESEEPELPEELVLLRRLLYLMRPEAGTCASG